jgi:hypothetical protein
VAVNLRDEAINELVGQKPPLHLNEIWAIRMCNEAGREEYGVGDATWIACDTRLLQLRPSYFIGRNRNWRNPFTLCIW